MPYFNPLFAFLWFHGFSKAVNMYPFLVPAHNESFAVLFARKLPSADGTPSDDYLINENLLALFHFHVACALDASATARRGKKGYFRQQVAYYGALTAKGVNWREQLQNLLEKWAPEFKELTKKSDAVHKKWQASTA